MSHVCKLHLKSKIQVHSYKKYSLPLFVLVKTKLVQEHSQDFTVVSRSEMRRAILNPKITERRELNHNDIKITTHRGYSSNKKVTLQSLACSLR